MTYLDTHVVVWLYAGDTERLPHGVQEIIDEDDLLVSPIVELELQYLHEIGKIGVKPKDVLARLSAELGLSVCGHQFGAVVAQAVSLSWTRDPFDRVITAQASLTNSRLLSKDKTIRAHYKQAFWD